jgi:hypothetical protein
LAYATAIIEANRPTLKGAPEMKKHAVGVVGLAALLGLLAGCATMSDVVESKAEGKGTAEVYPVTADQAWEIPKAVFRWEGADAIEEHRSEGYMLTSSGMNLVSYGAVMGAWIEPVTSGRTRVTVITKRRLSVNVATTMRETTFHKRFAQAVDMVKAGKELPLTAPD